MPQISGRERDEVRCWQSKLDASRKVWEPKKDEYRMYQDALENQFPAVVPGNRPFGGVVDIDPQYDQVNVNLVSRVMTYIKAKCFDASPEIRISGMRDIDVQLSNMNEHLISRVMERGGAPEASRNAIDDMGTLGPWIVWLGVDSYTINHQRMAGFATNVVDLVLAAAQGEEVHPIPGMDLTALAQTARNVHAQSPLPLTDFQAANLLRLALEAEVMFEKERSKPPSPVAKRIWYRATPYGSCCLVDSRVWEKMDAGWMARKITFSVDEFRAWDGFKPGARKNCDPQELGPEDGHEWISQPDENVGEYMNQCFVVWEIWDRMTSQVHYVNEGYEGYLEKDSSYPYNGEDGLPIFDDFFPCEWVVPYMHNKEKPDRVMGVPLIKYSYPQQLEVIKFESAIAADAKRGARMFEVSPGLDTDQKQNVQDGVDGTMIEKTQEDHMAGRSSVVALPNPPMGQDKLIARKLATEDFYAMSSVAPSQITGEPVAATLGQEELVTRGAGDIQGDIVSMIQVGYSKLARKSAALVRLTFTANQAGRYLDHKYVTPVMNQQGQVVEQAPFLQWKAESLDGVEITASFATKGASEDPSKIAQILQAVQLTFQAKDASGIYYKDPRPLLDLLFRRMGLGVIPDYKPSDNELMIRALQNMLQEQMRSGQGQAPQGTEPSGSPVEPSRGNPNTGTARKGPPAPKGGIPKGATQPRLPQGSPQGQGPQAKDMITTRVGPPRPE